MVLKSAVRAGSAAASRAARVALGSRRHSRALATRQRLKSGHQTPTYAPEKPETALPRGPQALTLPSTLCAGGLGAGTSGGGKHPTPAGGMGTVRQRPEGDLGQGCEEGHTGGGLQGRRRTRTWGGVERWRDPGGHARPLDEGGGL